MFTGIIEETGVVIRPYDSGRNSISIIAAQVLEGTKIGDSIAVNGVCLTVTSIGGGCFDADVMLTKSSVHFWMMVLSKPASHKVRTFMKWGWSWILRFWVFAQFQTCRPVNPLVLSTICQRSRIPFPKLSTKSLVSDLLRMVNSEFDRRR